MTLNILWCGNMYGQSFTIESPIKVISNMSEDEIQVATTIKNNTSKFLHLRWERTEKIPTEWESLVCDAQTCWTPAYNASDFVLAPNSIAQMYVSFLPNKSDGDGLVTLNVFDVKDAENTTSVNFYASATSNAEVARSYKDTKKILEKRQLTIYPNPTSYYFSVTPDSRVKKVHVFNIVGTIVREFEVKSFDQKYPIKELPEGIYLIRFLDEFNNIIKTVRLNKL